MSKKNYINTRIQTTNNEKTKSDIKHNLRLIKSRNNENSNQNINMDSAGNILNNQEMKNILLDYKDDRLLHSELFSENHNQNIRNRNSTWMSGVFTFSNAIHVEMGTEEEKLNKTEKSYTYIDEKTKEEITITGHVKYTQDDLIKIGIDAANDLAKHLGTDLKYMTLHLDEKTPHFQYHMGNFDNQGKSIFYKFRGKEELSKIQDLGHKHFGVLGMDRGEKKEFSNANYKTTQKHHEELLQDTKKDLSQSKKDLEKTILELTQKRKDVKGLEITQEEKNQLRKDYSQQLKTVKKELSQVNKDLKKRVNKIVNNSKTGTFGGINEEQLKKEIFRDMKENNNVKIELEDNKILVSKMEELEKENIDFYNKYTEIEKQSPKVLQEQVQSLTEALDTKTKQNTELYKSSREWEILQKSTQNEKDLISSELEEIKKKDTPDYTIHNKSKIDTSTGINTDIKR